MRTFPTATIPVLINLQTLIDEQKCYETVRQLRWSEGITCYKTVCHGKGEYASNEDGDGFHEVHVNTMEGFWSLLRSWLRPHRGFNQDQLPLYLGNFIVRSQRKNSG